jgi:DNA repair photolyase
MIDDVQVELVEADKAFERTRRACAREMAVINPARGCMFGCRFCPSKPKLLLEQGVKVRANIPKLLKRELSIRLKKGELPQSVLFNTSSDSFQPIQALLDVTHETMQMVLEQGCQLHFFTRGMVPPNFQKLFERFADKIHAQVSLLTMDETLSNIYEPSASKPQERLELIRRLLGWGVDVRARIEPLIPFLTDTVGHFEELIRYLRSVGLSYTSASYLVLRPHMLDLFKEVLPEAHFQLIKGSFKGQAWRKVGIRSMTKMLPERTRVKGYERLMKIGDKLDMQINICACQNPQKGSSCLAPLKSKSVITPNGDQLDLFASA